MISMMQYKTNDIPNEAQLNYLKILISKIFKILPMKEQNIATVNVHIDSLLTELIGYKDLFEYVQNDARLLTVICTLRALLNNDVSHSVCKREVFKCIKCIEQLIEEAS